MCAFLDFRAFRNEISADQIVNGVESIERNARELLDDARFLLENGRYARAMSLAIIAYEEAAKSLTALHLYAVQADEKVRKKVWKDYRSHVYKASPMGASFAGIAKDSIEFAINKPESFFKNGKDAIDSDFENALEKYKSLQDKGRIANKLKQHGLYADIYEHEGVDFWMAPSEFVSSDMAKRIVEDISANLSSRLGESSLQQRNADIREHVRAMDQHPKADIGSRWVALFESLANAHIEALKRERMRELREEAHRKQERNGP
jgi:AbiV family abortive infection protein